MFACVAMALGLTEGALGVRVLKKDEMSMSCIGCGVIEARLTESKHSLRTNMQCIH